LTEFTVGWAVTDRERDAISTLPARAWTPAVDSDGRLRDGAHVAELTGLLPARTLAGYPPGTRSRRTRRHPGRTTRHEHSKITTTRSTSSFESSS
jgi:hypothetical protein